MRKTNWLIGLVLVAGLVGCDSLLGDDPTPETIRYRVQGEAGAQVQLIISKQFVSGVTEAGITEVSLFQADTLNVTLPVDQDFDISLERRFFLQAVAADTAMDVSARVIVDVDGRPLFDDEGDLPDDPPFRFVYVFNQATTRLIEVF